MSNRHDPERIDHENPEWRVEAFARARPAVEVLGEIFGEEVVVEMCKPNPVVERQVSDQEEET